MAAGETLAAIFLRTHNLRGVCDVCAMDQSWAWVGGLTSSFFF